jgi:hypothetical protein
VLVQKTNLKISRPMFQQQHVVPQRRQRKQNLDVRVQKLRLQTTRRFQMYLCQQNYARNRVSVDCLKRDLRTSLRFLQ